MLKCVCSLQLARYQTPLVVRVQFCVKFYKSKNGMLPEIERSERFTLLLIN